MVEARQRAKRAATPHADASPTEDAPTHAAATSTATPPLHHVIYLSLFGLLLLESGLVATPYVAHLLLASLFTLVVGCHRCLVAEATEVVEGKSAALFPLFAGGGLLSIYAAIKTLGSDGINSVLCWYFAGLGVGTVGALVSPLVALLPWVGGGGGGGANDAPLFHLPWWGPVWLPSRLQLVSYSVGGAVSGCYLMTQHWALNNALAIAVSVESIGGIPLDSFSAGLVLLSGLFVYDIVMVFNLLPAQLGLKESPMILVATKLDAPIKLLFPRGGLDAETGRFAHSLLGLGDIVVPGLFLALLLRFDYTRHVAGQPKRKSLVPLDIEFASFPKPYFYNAMCAYVAGLVLTVGVMVLFAHGQPALLYLCPAVSLAALGTAVYRGELGALWRFSDDAFRSAVGGGGGVEAKMD